MSDLKRKKKEYTGVTGGEYSRKRCYRRYYRSASEFENGAVEPSVEVGEWCRCQWTHGAIGVTGGSIVDGENGDVGAELQK